MSITFAAALAFCAAFAFCVIAAAWDFYPDITQPGAGVSAIGLVASVVALHLGAGDDDGE